MTKKKYTNPLFTLTPTNPTEPYTLSEEIGGSDPIGGTTYSFDSGFTVNMLAMLGSLSDSELANLDSNGDHTITVEEYNAYFGETGE